MPKAVNVFWVSHAGFGWNAPQRSSSLTGVGKEKGAKKGEERVCGGYAAVYSQVFVSHTLAYVFLIMIEAK